MLRLMAEIKFGQDAVLCCVDEDDRPTYNTLPDEIIYDNDVVTNNKVVVLNTVDDCDSLYRRLFVHQICWWVGFVFAHFVVAVTYMWGGAWCFVGMAAVALLVSDKVMNIPDGCIIDATGNKLDVKNRLIYIPNGEIVAIGRD